MTKLDISFPTELCLQLYILSLYSCTEAENGLKQPEHVYDCAVLRQLINCVYTHTKQWDESCQISRDICTLLNQGAVLSNPALSVRYITLLMTLTRA